MRKTTKQTKRGAQSELRTSAKALVCGLCVMVLGSQCAAAKTTSEGLVTVESGDLPVILSAPHGGRQAIPDVPVRQGQGVKSFVTKADDWTDQLAGKLAAAIEQQTGKRPYVVIARFHRKYLDANRPAEGAYESDRAKTAYDTYHKALAAARRDVLRRWGQGILFDIHGQGAESKTIFRGTQNGRTTTHLVEKSGKPALVGEDSVFGQLAKQGLQVNPAVDSDDREHSSYNGGYIVRTYGSGSGGSLDAIQLELGRDLRRPAANQTTAEKVAAAIAAFAGDYLPNDELTAEEIEKQHQLEGVRVGVYQDVGSGRSTKDLLRALAEFDGISVRKLMAADIRAGVLSDLDVLIQPGGSGGTQGRYLGNDGRKQIRDFLRQGGGYIGICAGAYLASADYDWSLDILDAKVVDRKHWARGKGMVNIELSDQGKRLLQSDQEQLEIYYGQGPLLAPGEHADIDDYQPAAIYKTEIAKNGAPAGVMKGTTAIARGRFGRGRVICFSPHPELTKGLEKLVHHAINHVSEESP